MSKDLPSARIEPRGISGHLRRAGARARFTGRIVLSIALALGLLIGAGALRSWMRSDPARDEIERDERELAYYERECPRTPHECRAFAQRRYQRAMHALRSMTGGSRASSAPVALPIPHAPRSMMEQ